MTAPTEKNLKAAFNLLSLAEQQEDTPQFEIEDIALALDAKDAEIARLRAAIAKVPEYPRSADTGQRQCAFCLRGWTVIHTQDCEWVRAKKESVDA